MPSFLRVSRGPGPARGAARRRVLARLPLVLAAVGLALPHAALELWRALVAGGWVSAATVLALASAGAWAVAGAAPPANDPEVHDRQVDLILAGCLGAVGCWFVLGWPATAAWTAPDAGAAVLVGCGCALVVLGTRPTGRMLPGLAVPLLSVPLLTHHPVALGLALLVVATLAARALVRSPSGPVADRPERLPRLRGGLLLNVLAAAFGLLTGVGRGVGVVGG